MLKNILLVIIYTILLFHVTLKEESPVSKQNESERGMSVRPILLEVLV
ncbi:hypothetical protein B4110_0869 [Parageobacillus toebii]|uniref:Uncharacterized protein n=1 Tax=Parageobacillus toebii TaxID=153151 RepID=A0A150N467_9BACL|nr:hypothetical protein B4110_0869 [Parageobacillus toebii]